MFGPGRDEEGAAAVVTPVGPVLGTLLLVTLQPGLAGQLLGTSLAFVDIRLTGVHQLLADKPVGLEWPYLFSCALTSIV